VVRWNGANRSTTYVSATQVTAAITAADVALAGTAPVTVFNPAPGGGTSNGQTFTVMNPVPSMDGLSPTSAPAGGPGFTLTITGTNFVASSAVRWNGASRATTYVSPTQVTAAIPAADLAVAGSVAVTVFNPAPGGGTSNPFSFAILAPGSVFDDFNRANSANLGNGWIERTPATFSLAGNRVTKAATGTGYRDNLAYRPSGENRLNAEASVEARLNGLPPAYPSVFVRGQTTLGFSGYLLHIDDDLAQASLYRIEPGPSMVTVPPPGSNATLLAQIAISPVLNTTDTFRLRLRATGILPVALQAYVERLTPSGWQIIGQATVDDGGLLQILTAGTAGFTGHVEGPVYSFDNFTRMSLD
jgi:hypothetical protein